MSRTTDSRLPAGTIPGIIILAILAALAGGHAPVRVHHPHRRRRGVRRQ